MALTSSRYFFGPPHVVLANTPQQLCIILILSSSVIPRKMKIFYLETIFYIDASRKWLQVSN